LTPEAAIAQAKKGALLPVYVVTGEEDFLRDQVVAELRAAALGGGVPAFNEDKFTAGEASIDKVLAAVRTVPMMAPRRFVSIRGAERWDQDTSDASEERDSRREAPLDRLADYAGAPIDSTCLVITSSKLDGRRRLSNVAKKLGCIVTCEPLHGTALVSWIERQVSLRGNSIAPDVAELIAEIAGTDLARLSDVVERLCLFVGAPSSLSPTGGAGGLITEEAVGECVARVKTADTWALVDAVGKRDLAGGLRLLADVYDSRDRGLPLLGALAWSIRQLAKFQIAVEGGAATDEAARRAGIFQPSRAREVAQKARALKAKELERWLLVLADTDVALKSSRRPADAILEDMITRLCRR
jgi:DNA polymerase III subunit delta